MNYFRDAMNEVLPGQDDADLALHDNVQVCLECMEAHLETLCEAEDDTISPRARYVILGAVREARAARAFLSEWIEAKNEAIGVEE